MVEDIVGDRDARGRDHDVVRAARNDVAFEVRPDDLARLLVDDDICPLRSKCRRECNRHADPPRRDSVPDVRSVYIADSR